MDSYSLSAAAKINLYLEVIGDRPDGYHELVMVMQSVSLSDRLTLRRLNVPAIRLNCDHPLVPNDSSNLVHKAVVLLQSRFPQAWKQYGGVEITLEKNIPVGAGLAGGSTNAAATLIGLDMLWQLGLTQIELQTLGAELGSDVPFCIAGGTAIATGRGEQVDSLYGIDNLYVVLAKYQNLSVSTPWAYQTYRQQFASTYVSVSVERESRQEALRSGAMVAAISHQNGSEIGEHLHNDLEKVVLPAHPDVQKLKETMVSCGGLGTLMSGSGPTVFTLTATQAEAEAIAEQTRSRLSDPDLQLWVTSFTPTSIQMVT
ncbi:4-(cytidine 5'-diphospho)-2-C-methyl-D-erythritol kinase [Oscillatoria sp. CS-180]|uniref:4-(cytidine 5'-diphospho)-2-C-methyl-D-erythritol kinase n=1 Tax=Oscillatoria sp. CS-180 TaxID=3021720 RepID=UPI00232FFED0|nr:4-(cytidine 5'-diphospho)-2-C-methyl-D-erythritol kinase [Oscillatoria sp. CS-180]MDB9528009.1 4-(cytidine 5'-diphospho)-2-C-methyl-D-erythritol kinase [Oscillatoria sp. CS-180]